MKRAMLVIMFILAVSGLLLAQNWSSPIDVLGAHNNNGRGCAGCHSPHSGSWGSGHAQKSGFNDTGNFALWGQDATPLYGYTLAFGDSGRYIEVLPGSLTAGGVEVSGIMLCLSCHDGNVTANNMMTNHSYEQRIGYLTNTAYGSAPIPTLLGNDGTTAGNYNNDHPVGLNATISTTSNGLVWSGNTFTVTAGTPYYAFVQNYGMPVLGPGAHGVAYGISPAGKPFVACTTCHNQHVMTVYSDSSANQIAADGGGKFYATMFFVNAPYNPNLAYNNGLGGGTTAPSTTQFCRECHFGEANEGNNTYGIKTQFQ